MSGAEALAIIGGISAILDLIKTAKEVFDAAADTEGLPEAFRVVAARLPLVQATLEAVEKSLRNEAVDEQSCKAARKVVEACETKVQKLEKIFEKVTPTSASGGGSRWERYKSAVKTIGKGDRVETLMRGILEDIQLLVSERGIKTANAAENIAIAEAIEEVSDLPSSIPENAEGDFNVNYSGSGNQTNYNAHGQYVAQGEARQYISGGGPMNFDKIIYNIRNISVSQKPAEDKAMACLKALYLTDPSVDRETILNIAGSRAGGTCEWIKNNELYRSWVCSRSQLLWISGGPGKGKTMLSIYLAEELEKIAKESPQNVLIQYFCDNKDDKRNTAMAIIRGLMLQLIQWRPDLLSYVLPEFTLKEQSLFAASSFPALWNIFRRMICDSNLGTIYCIIDGLDECEEYTLKLLLTYLRELYSEDAWKDPGGPLKVVTTSRDFPKFIAETLHIFPRIRLDPDETGHVLSDIGEFIDSKVERLAATKSYSEQLCRYVKEVFNQRAEGTFLWVGLVAKSLEEYTSDEVESALELFQPGLNSIYNRMVLQIKENRREIAAEIIRWVVMAARPLKLKELNDAIGTAPTANFTNEEVTRGRVSSCGYFLTIEGDEIRMIHQSARDYFLRTHTDPDDILERFRVKPYDANLRIVRRCFQYIEEYAVFSNREGLLSKSFVRNPQAPPFLLYATRYWTEHAGNLSEHEDIFESSKPIYQTGSPTRIVWASVIDGRDNWLASGGTVLHLASRFSLLPLAQRTLNKARHNKLRLLYLLSKKNWDDETALHIAAKYGNGEIVKLLLEKGAAPDVKDRRGRTPLYLAASTSEDVVQLLLDRRAKVNPKVDNVDTPLHEATRYKKPDIVRVLLQHRAAVNAKDEISNTALHLAAESDSEDVVRLLLEAGADVNAEDRYGNTALHRASNNASIINLLLDGGAKIEARSQYGVTELHRASRMNFVLNISALLEGGANIEAKDEDGQTALHYAASNGQTSAISELLRKGADIEAKDHVGCTALHWAAVQSQTSAISELLKRGADIEAKDSDGRTPLHCAALVSISAPGASAISELLKKGADIEAKDRAGYTALHLAASQSDISVVAELLKSGADIEAKSISGQNPLHVATFHNWVDNRNEMISELLRNGADSTAKDRDGKTALDIAVESGSQPKVIRSLRRQSRPPIDRISVATSTTKVLHLELA